MAYTTYPLTQEGLEEAENTWHTQAVTGDVKFGVDVDTKRLVVIPKSDQKNYNSAKAYASPREAEQAVIGNQPTRTIPGQLLGASIAPRQQYHITNPVHFDAQGNLYPKGRKGDPIRDEQSNEAADFIQDRIGNLANFGPVAAAATTSVKYLPLSKLMPGAALASAGLNVANNMIGASRGDALYNETIPNIALTAAGVAGGAALAKMSSKRDQIRREIDDLINLRMRNKKGTKVPKELRDAIMEGGKAGVPYTFGDWIYAPIDNVMAKHPEIPKLPVVYKMPEQVIKTKTGKIIPRRPDTARLIDKDVATQWLINHKIDPNKYEIADVVEGLQKMYNYPGVTRESRLFYPRKGEPQLTQDTWKNWKGTEKNPFIADMLSDVDLVTDNPTIDKDWKGAKADMRQRGTKARTAVREEIQAEGNKGKMRGEGVDIIPQSKYESLGSKGKWRRRFGKAGAFLLPVATEVFGKYLLPTGGKNDR
jgi:hypothetical protein